jgi:hypothetical protein
MGITICFAECLVKPSKRPTCLPVRNGRQPLKVSSCLDIGLRCGGPRRRRAPPEGRIFTPGFFKSLFISSCGDHMDGMLSGVSLGAVSAFPAIFGRSLSGAIRGQAEPWADAVTARGPGADMGCLPTTAFISAERSRESFG